MKKIVVIGPVYPYKGGISHYTSLMSNALAKEYDVTVASFKLQYPKFMYKKEQKDYENDSFKPDNVEYMINTANPFNWITTAHKLRKMKPDMIIMQWWHPYFAPCYWCIEKMTRKIKKLFVCHNVFPHERFPMDRKLAKMVLKNGSRFIVQSSMDKDDLLSIKPDAVFEQTVHPTYNAFRIKNMGRDEARELLGIGKEDNVMLFFGFVREYKGLKHLLRAMPEIKQNVPNVKLLVVGEFGGDKEDYMSIINENEISDVVEIHDGYTPDNEVEQYFAASNVCVLPYESATQSGIVQIAYGFEMPVIVTRVGGLPDVVTDGKTGIIVEPENHKAIAQAVIKYYNNSLETEYRQHVLEESYRYSWDRMVEVVDRLGEETR